MEHHRYLVAFWVFCMVIFVVGLWAAKKEREEHRRKKDEEKK
jgi:hypothetical protein